MPLGIAPTPWEVLGVPEGSSPAVVRTAFRRGVRQFHPDAAEHGDVERFKAVNDAYAALHHRSTPVRGSDPVVFPARPVPADQEWNPPAPEWMSAPAPGPDLGPSAGQAAADLLAQEPTARRRPNPRQGPSGRGTSGPVSTDGRRSLRGARRSARPTSGDQTGRGPGRALVARFGVPAAAGLAFVLARLAAQAVTSWAAPVSVALLVGVAVPIAAVCVVVFDRSRAAADAAAEDPANSPILVLAALGASATLAWADVLFRLGTPIAAAAGLLAAILRHRRSTETSR